MSDGEVEACTKALSLLRNLRPELDPVKAQHLAVVADVAALFSHALARIVISIFAGYLQPASREELSTALNYLLYGGRSSYEHRNRIKKLLAQAGKEEEEGLQTLLCRIGAGLSSSFGRCSTRRSRPRDRHSCSAKSVGAFWPQAETQHWGRVWQTSRPKGYGSLFRLLITYVRQVTYLPNSTGTLETGCWL